MDQNLLGTARIVRTIKQVRNLRFLIASLCFYSLAEDLLPSPARVSWLLLPLAACGKASVGLAGTSGLAWACGLLVRVVQFKAVP